MRAIPFTKVEAIGNNFVLIDALSLPEMEWSALAIKMCEHHFGVGSDGLLVLKPSDKADFKMLMFNPDGTADSCGNGLRCVARYVHAEGLTDKKEIVFEARDGLRQTEIMEACLPRSIGGVKMNMGRPSFQSADIPSEMVNLPLEVGGETYNVTAVLIGTPHAVIFAPLESFWETIPSVSAEIEHHPAFPERINVTWCACESPESLRVRTWERGVGPTMGCGTGASAALVAANLNGIAGTCATVTSPGGSLLVEWPNKGDLFVSGPANIVYQGEWPL
jgi:diaminopimelate epimerase